MNRELLTKLIKSKKALEGVPVVGNIDFGHTVPMITLPIGGKVKFSAAADDQVSINILEH